MTLFIVIVETDVRISLFFLRIVKGETLTLNHNDAKAMTAKKNCTYEVKESSVSKTEQYSSDVELERRRKDITTWRGDGGD